MWRFIITLVAGAAFLVSIGVALQITAPRRNLEDARARWNAAPIEHYRLDVRMVGWGGCSQSAEIHRELIRAIERNTCRFFSPRTVTSLFSEVERFVRLPEAGNACRRGIPGRDCACYIPYQTVITYNAERGYPEQVRITWGAYKPNRAHRDYWSHLLRTGREPRCGGPVEPPGRHLDIRLTPLDAPSAVDQR